MPSILCRAKTKQVHCACCKLLHTLIHAHTLSLPLSVEHSHTHSLSLAQALTFSHLQALSLSLSLSLSQREIGPQLVLQFSLCLLFGLLSLSLILFLSLFQQEASSCLSKTEAPSRGVSGPKSIFSLHPIFLNLLSQSMPCTGRLGKMYCWDSTVARKQPREVTAP